MVDADSHRFLIALEAVAPGAAADLLGSTIPVGDRTLGSAIDIADITPTARLSERRLFTGNREWDYCGLIAFITGWFVLFFVRYPGEAAHARGVESCRPGLSCGHRFMCQSLMTCRSTRTRCSLGVAGEWVNRSALHEIAMRRCAFLDSRRLPRPRICRSGRLDPAAWNPRPGGLGVDRRGSEDQRSIDQMR
jgi:hypothetical protein